MEQRSGNQESDVLIIEEREPALETTGEGVGLAVRERPRAKFVVQSDREYYVDKASRVVIRHRLGWVVAFIEVVSPGNKHDELSFVDFRDKIVESIRNRVHVLANDLFPPTLRNPSGIHKAIWDHFEEDEPSELTNVQNRVFASYEADGVTTAFVETLAVSEPLPKMPLFIAPGAHILVPLEDTYTQAWMKTPKSVRRLVQSAA